MPSAEFVLVALEDPVLLRERVKTVEIDGEGVIDLDLKLVDDSVGTAEDDLEFNADRESV